ncbi:hypothetical protein GCM10009733_061020 [Nonomuraea maheshkhaliensis]|uniref:Uncharacterized protein n=1 Tax=Nonomuraea maheshkhaliensis TaxID=419590 RepID=A0ABP4RK41_9ACTN
MKAQIKGTTVTQTLPPDPTGQSKQCDADQSLMDRTENEPDSGPPNGYSDHAPLIGYLPGREPGARRGRRPIGGRCPRPGSSLSYCCVAKMGG